MNFKMEHILKTDIDWRLNAYSFLAEDWVSPWTQQISKKGTQLTVVACAKNRAGNEISVPVPNATAMMLNSSRRAYKSAEELRRKDKLDVRGNHNGVFKNNAVAIDYLELMIESVVTAHIGVEAFANEWIPEDHIYSKTTKEGILKTYNKEEIERYIPLCEKLSDILPNLFSIASPKGLKYWQHYSRLKKIRDRITHMKAEDRKSAGSEIDTIWRSLLTVEPPHLDALSIIKYFDAHLTPYPGWLKSGKI
jgi:hypothetical protein